MLRGYNPAPAAAGLVAPVAGTDVTPDFGAQNILTTGNIQVNTLQATNHLRIGALAAAATAGAIRMASGATMRWLHTDGVTNVTGFSVNASNQLALKDDAVLIDTNLNVVNGYILAGANTTRATAGTAFRLPKLASAFVRNNADSANLCVWDMDTANRLWLGGDQNQGNLFTQIGLYASSSVSLGISSGGTATKLTINANECQINVPITGSGAGTVSFYGVHGVGPQAMADNDQTVANTVYKYGKIRCTGALTVGPKTLTVPTAADSFGYWKDIENACTGPAATYIIVTTGSGTVVNVPNGFTQKVFVDANGVSPVGPAAAKGSICVMQDVGALFTPQSGLLRVSGAGASTHSVKILVGNYAGTDRDILSTDTSATTELKLGNSSLPTAMEGSTCRLVTVGAVETQGPLIGTSGTTPSRPSPYGVHGTNSTGTGAIADANYTPAATVYCFYTLRFTGTLSTLKDLVLPLPSAAARSYTKIIDLRGVTGAGGYAVKCSSGTVVNVAAGACVEVLVDETGVRRSLDNHYIMPTRETSTGFTLVHGQHYEVIASTGGITLTLPASPVAGETYRIGNIAGTSITVNGGGHNIRGAATDTLNQYDTFTYRYSATSGVWVR